MKVFHGIVIQQSLKNNVQVEDLCYVLKTKIDDENANSSLSTLNDMIKGNVVPTMKSWDMRYKIQKVHPFESPILFDTETNSPVNFNRYDTLSTVLNLMNIHDSAMKNSTYAELEEQTEIISENNSWHFDSDMLYYIYD